MFEGSVNVVSPGAYVVSDGRGDIGASSKEGLFYRDTRHLSEFVLRVNGEAPIALDARARGSEAEFVLAVGAGSIRVVRWRTLGGGMAEEILLKNYAREAIEARVELGCAADFRDVFGVRGYHRAQERGELAEEAGDGCLRFAYRRGGFWRGTVVRVSSEGEEVLVEPGLAFLDLRLGPGESRLVRASVLFEESGEEIRWRRPALLYAEAPELETHWEVLGKSWERSVEDLKSLSFDAGNGMIVPAAGAPWYMALFGRDALISAYQIMILDSEPAKNVLRVLAKYQAVERDDFRDAEPGKILHELRFGELAFFGEVPHSPYYGTVDATPLFLILLHEVWRWTADEGFVRGLEGAARRALSWLLEHADTNGDGYVDYETRSERGLENHSWRDSADSMLFRNGTRAEGPIASCEVQGYAYDALLRTAELAEVVWGDAELARRLRGEAGELKERFDQDFWIEEGGYYALALDGAGRRVDSLTSNIGHLLWSGIVPAEKARAVVDHLLGGRLFGGFGVRTMAEGDAGYDAESYHTGTVWPHDNSLVAYGLYRCGFREEANYLTATLLDAAPHFHYRLPEVFAGYSREQASSPIPYPTSCSPQAWAAGSVPLLLRAMLGLEPDPHKRQLLFNPALPEDVSAVGLLGLTVFGRRYDLRA